MKEKILVIIGSLCGTYLLLSQYLRMDSNDKTILATTQEVREVQPTLKTILYWTPMVRRADWYLGFGSGIFEKCVYKNCYATNDREALAVEKFDAILFHGFEYSATKFGKPAKRDPRQIYIFGNLESPAYTPRYINDHNDFYNWTMTYRSDSDIVRRYGYIEERPTNYEPPSIEEIQKRPKKIAWFVSHCHTMGKRERLYEKMKKYIEIDAYGNCYKLKCSRRNEAECYDMIERQYKFYLSFENSVCNEYVTEKLYNILKRNIVPIVYGGANYTACSPRNSVINVVDFKSVKHLVDYINHLDTHPEEYLKFFEWKKSSSSVSEKRVPCDLCAKLNQPITPKSYNSIAKWWNGLQTKQCSNKIIHQFL